ncbi:MAG: hypothetical protein AAF371_19990 [Pseudomonadota bacterium]
MTRPTPLVPAIQPAREAEGAHAAGEYGALPVWDLGALYQGPDDPALAADLETSGKEAQAFAERYEGKLGTLDGDGLAEAVKAYEAMQSRLGRVMSFAMLRYAQNTQDPARAQMMGNLQVQVTALTQPMVFFTLELNRLSADKLEAAYAESAALKRYNPWLDRVRALAPHQLSDELEKFLHDMSVVGASAWNRLFDETMSGLTFNVDGETLALEATLTLLQDRDRAKRESAGRAVAQVLGENIRLFTLITNTLAKEKEIEDRWRRMPAPDHGRHLANQVCEDIEGGKRDLDGGPAGHLRRR